MAAIKPTRRYPRLPAALSAGLAVIAMIAAELAVSEGVEPPTSWFVARRSIQLS